MILRELVTTRPPWARFTFNVWGFPVSLSLLPREPILPCSDSDGPPQSLLKAEQQESCHNCNGAITFLWKLCEEMLLKQSFASWVTFVSAVIPALPCMLQVSMLKKAISIPRILVGWNVTTLTFSGLSFSQLLSLFTDNMMRTCYIQVLFSIPV